LDIPQHLQDLPDVVSPHELVRKEFESIAWTQRASFSVQPVQRILMVNPGLGLPHITEVVRCPDILEVYLIKLCFQRDPDFSFERLIKFSRSKSTPTSNYHSRHERNTEVAQ